MDDTVYALLKELLEGKQRDDRVFTRADGRPVKDFRGAWQNLCIRACVLGPDGKPSRFECGKCNASMKVGTSICRACGGRRRYVGLIVHDMRRSAARNLLHAGVPETDVMNTLGHKTRSMVTRYAIFDPNASRRAMEKLAQYERTMKALAEAEKQLNPHIDPPGVETGPTDQGKERTRVQ
jgi:integrase